MVRSNPFGDYLRGNITRLRPIIPTKAQENALARMYLTVLDVWSTGARDRIVPAYRLSLSQITTDSPADLEAEITATEENAVRATFNFRSVFAAWAEKFMRWHLGKIGSMLGYANNVSLETQLGGAPGTIADYLARNTALVRSVSDEARARIADIVFRGLQARTPVRDVAKQIDAAVGLGRARSLRIASDQSVKLSGALDALRGEELGFDGYIWRHSHKAHPRPEHVARDGQYFAFGSPVDVNDPPGQLPFCGCKRQLSMDTADDS